MTPEKLLTPDAKSSKGCYKPIRLTQIDETTGELPIGGKSIYARCGSRHETKCASCAEVYRRDAITLIEKGVPKRRRKGYHLLFVTLTAPGAEYFGSSNHRTNGQFTGKCPCGTAHKHDDEILGAPLDFDKFNYDLAVRWNLALPELWRRYLIALEREFPTQRIEYVKVVEVQRRGLFHIHAIIRIEPTTANEFILDRDVVKAGVVASSKIPNVDGHKFGKQIDVKFARQNPPKKRKNETQNDYQKRVRQSLTRNTFARYLAKYATKGSDHAKRKGTIGKYVIAHQVKLKEAARPYAIAWHQEKLANWKEEQRQLPLTERADTFMKKRNEVIYETRANSIVEAFGFSGQFLTKSSKYSTTFKKLRDKARQVAIKKVQDLYGKIQDNHKWVVVGFGLLNEHHDYVVNYWKENLKIRGYEPPVFLPV